jgi:hypothetical protein
VQRELIPLRIRDEDRAAVRKVVQLARRRAVRDEALAQRRDVVHFERNARRLAGLESKALAVADTERPCADGELDPVVCRNACASSV